MTFLGSHNVTYSVDNNNVLYVHAHNVASVQSALRTANRSGYSGNVSAAQAVGIGLAAANPSFMNNYTQDIYIHVPLD
jgi:hypothetical protein